MSTEKKKFDINKLNEYKMHWCLYKQFYGSYHKQYDTIFIVDIKQNIIMSYNDKINKYEYIPVSEFEDKEFFVSPFNEESPLKNKNNSDDDWTYDPKRIHIPTIPSPQDPYPPVRFPDEGNCHKQHYPYPIVYCCVK